MLFFLFLSDKISTLFNSFVGDMMDNFVGNLFDLDWKLMVVHMFQMVIASVLVLPVGYNRENSRQSIGLRTFPLVSLASCSFALLAFEERNGAHRKRRGNRDWLYRRRGNSQKRWHD